MAFSAPPPEQDSAAQDSAETDSAGEKSLELIELVRQIQPSVVTIHVLGRDGSELAMGTGFVIDSEGLIATNLHVIGEGRPFTVELPGKRQVDVIAIESTDPIADLAIIRVDPGAEIVEALPLFEELPQQGTDIVAFGNPLGLRDSVVAGIVSAIREVEGREMIQLAMPTQPGNSGGPLIDKQGRVRGIINMKSAVDDNLGFAIPVSQLKPIRDEPNPVTYDRWVTLGRLDEKTWMPLFGASWQQRGGVISAIGLGTGFGGRALCLRRSAMPELPFEISLDVRLDDETGAAGLAFHSNEGDRHYGFYPSNGRMRLTCFKGPSVYSWEVLDDVETSHYRPGQWNHLRVRIERDKLLCYVNDHLVIESTDRQLTSGKTGVVKFRSTEPDFKRFQVGSDLARPTVSDGTRETLRVAMKQARSQIEVGAKELQELSESSNAVTRELRRRASKLEQDAERLRRLAADVTLAATLRELAKAMQHDDDDAPNLLRGALLIAQIDNAELDVDAYMMRIDEMATEISADLESDAGASDRRDALHQYLFEQNGYHGGRTEYYHPANSHLDRVIDEREGLPISLSILYMELAKRIGISVEGVGLPGHFVVRQVIDDDSSQLIDVFDRGTLLSRQDAARLVVMYAGRAIRGDDLRPQSEVEILTRLVNNLMGIASRQSDVKAIHRYCEALVTISPDSPESRMLRSQARALTQRHSAAVEDLDWLIERAPPGFDRVRAMELRNSLILREEQER